MCESILGLNDWITTQRPNLCQKTKSTLVEVKKKNHTMNWLDSLSTEKQNTVVEMAQRNRRKVEAATRSDEQELKNERIKKMEEEKRKAEEKESRKQLELEKLRDVQMVNTVEELDEEFEKIDQEKATISAKAKKKLQLLKNQVRIHNKLFQKGIKITFSTSGKPKAVDELYVEVCDVLQKEAETKKRPNATGSVNCRAKRTKQLATAFLETPEQLVGLDIIHKFINTETSIAIEEFWDGRILSYDPAKNTHKLSYTGDKEEYEYDLTEDINNGDLWVLV